jgi:hypothetical protein
MHIRIFFAAAFATFVSMTSTSNAQDNNLLPSGLVVEAYQGGWRDGGSDPSAECLKHFNQKYPTKRIQIIDVGEESKKDLLGHVEYKYRCTAAVQTK